jgi:hypothetical protein
MLAPIARSRRDFHGRGVGFPSRDTDFPRRDIDFLRRGIDFVSPALDFRWSRLDSLRDDGDFRAALVISRVSVFISQRSASIARP